jgi:ATP-dependent DNA ligase
MEALLVAALPTGPEWQYEPKWDGFRCLAFRDKRKVVLQSKAGRPLERYFPELAEAFLAIPPQHCVVDGEIIVPVGDTFDFDQLLARIHPAASRVEKLAREFPARFMFFDLLANEKGRSLVHLPLVERRVLLEIFFKQHLAGRNAFQLSPATRSVAEAKKWLAKAGPGLDGIVAKRLDLPYCSGERTGMQKFKPLRTVDCVVGGFRYAEKKPVVGSLLLGLYDDGLLHHVGFTSGLNAAERETLLKKLRPLIQPPGFTGQAPGGPSRWSSERSAKWEPLKPKLVVEVAYDHVTNNRFRHGTRLIRWRPDKAPAQCTLDQIKTPAVSRLLSLDRAR